MKNILLTFSLAIITIVRASAQEIDLSQFDKREIKDVLTKANMPKTLVLSSNCFDPKYTDARIVDAAINKINEYLNKLRIPYVSYSSTQDLMQGYGGSQNYRDIAMKANTTNYIVVMLVKSELGKLNNLAYYSSVNITLEAFDTENGLGIGSYSGSSCKIGSSVSQVEANFQASCEAASKGAEEIIPQLIDHYKDSENEGVYYEIRLFGVKDIIEAQAFKKILTGIQEFTGIIRISNGPDYYRYEITYNSKRPDIIVDKIIGEAIRPESILRKIDKCSDPGKLTNFCLPR